MRRGGGICAALAALALTGCGALSRGELERGAQSLGALAAEGRLLADGVARDDTKATYVRVMARTLGERAQHQAEKLADATPSEGLAARRDEAVELAGSVAEQLSQLQTLPGDERTGRAVAQRLRALQDDADHLDAALGSERP